MTPPLHVDRWGEGQPVLFLHGLGASSRYWHGVAERGGHSSGTAPDLLGFGRSPKPDGATYDVEEHLDTLAPLLEADCVVVGHSAGAILASALAARCRELVSGLVLVGLPAYPDEATAREEIGRLGPLARWTVEGNPLGHLVCSAMCALRPLATAIAPIVIRDLPREIASDGALHTWPSYSRTLEQVVVGHRPFEDLHRVGRPIRLLHGADDRQAPVEHLQPLVDKARDSGVDIELHVYSGDHHLPVRRPDAVVDAINLLRT